MPTLSSSASVYRKTFASRTVPDYYYGQLQHILAVTALELIDFWCYLPNRPELHLRVERNEKYIGRMLEIEHQFWETLKKRRKTNNTASFLKDK